MSFLTTFSDEASKTYKDAARTATTGPIDLSSAPASIGSVNLNLNDRVLVKDQLNGADNGIYLFKGAGLPMVRSTDANSSREVLPNMLISVSEGDYEDKIFELTTNGPIVLGTTPLSFGLAILPIDLTTDVVGVLPVANGGTNRSSWTEGRIPFAGSSGSSLTEDSELNWVNSTKRLGIGTSTPNAKVQINNSGTQVGLSVYSTSTNNALQFFNEGATSYTAAFYNSADSAQTGASIGGYFSRGTLAARTQSLANDVLLSLTGSGYTGSAFAPSVSGGIVVAADQDTTAGGFGGQVSIVTTPNNTVGLPVPRLVVKNDGKVGIGTLTPTGFLQVEDNVPTTNLYLGNIPGNPESPGSRGTAWLINNGGDAILYLSNNDQINAAAGNLVNNGGVLDFHGRNSSSIPTASKTFARVGGFKENNTNGDSAGYLSFYTRGPGSPLTLSERMRIDSSGNVGIGTTTPDSNLTIEKNGNAVLALTAYGTGNFPLVRSRFANGTQAAPTATAINDRLAIFDGGGHDGSSFVGASARIEYNAAEAFTPTARGGQISFFTVGTGLTTLSERMRITSAGNVGIGVSSPTQQLQVAGNVKAEGLLLQSRHALTGAVTVLSNDYYVGCNSSGGAVTVALQAAATAKQG